MSSISSLSSNLANLLQSSGSASTASGLSALLGTQSGGGIAELAGATNGTQISQMGQFFNNLRTLQDTNPSEFQQLMSSISSQLSSAATQAGAGTNQGNFLSQLANQFASVANGGNLSQLLPQQQSPQSLAEQAYFQVQQSVSSSLIQALNSSNSGSSSGDPMDSLLTSSLGLGNSSSSSEIQSLLSTTGSAGNSSSTDTSPLFQSIVQQVQQALSSSATNTPSA
jgi:hypothetical protein